MRSLRVAAQQQVEIAKALTLDAKLLILDEPTAALGGEETEHLFAVIDQLRAEGVSFIYISHRLEEIARIADRIVVLRDGRWVASHDTAQVPVRTAGRGHGRPQPRADVPGHGRRRVRRGPAGDGPDARNGVPRRVVLRARGRDPRHRRDRRRRPHRARAGDRRRRPGGRRDGQRSTARRCGSATR